MLVSLQSSVSVPSSCPNFLKTFLSKHYLVIYSSPKPQPQIQKCCSRKDIRNSQELCRSVSTLVGSKNSYGILIKHTDGELGAVELRVRRDSGSLSLFWLGLCGNLAHLVATSVWYFSTWNWGEPCLPLQTCIWDLFSAIALSQLLACTSILLSPYHTGDFSNYARLRPHVLLLSKSYPSCKWIRVAIYMFGIEF